MIYYLNVNHAKDALNIIKKYGNVYSDEYLITTDVNDEAMFAEIKLTYGIDFDSVEGDLTGDPLYDVWTGLFHQALKTDSLCLVDFLNHYDIDNYFPKDSEGLILELYLRLYRCGETNVIDEIVKHHFL